MNRTKPPRVPRVTLPYAPPAESIADSIERHLREHELRFEPRPRITVRPLPPRRR